MSEDVKKKELSGITKTDITLPFISYGGSSLILTLVMIAVVLNISKYQED
jgi:cell division protein FtsW